MALYNQMPIRLQADLVSNPPVVPVDANTGLPPQFWRSQGIQVSLGVFQNGVSVDLSNLVYVQLIIQDAQDSLIPTVVKQVDAGSIIPVISKAKWDAGYAQQALFTLSVAETDLSLSGQSERDYWMVVVGRTTGGGNIVYAAGPVRVFNPAGTIPAPVATPIISGHEQTSDTDVMVSPSTQIHFEEITVTGMAGTRDVTVLAAGLDKGARCSLRFILPAVDGINLRVFDQSTSNTLLTTITSQGDGFLPAARVELWFDGTAWKRDFLIMPAFGQQT